MQNSLMVFSAHVPYKYIAQSGCHKVIYCIFNMYITVYSAGVRCLNMY